MKIMFICTGNICRSAMAEWLLKQKVKDKKIENIEVYSCGIYAQDGDTPTWEAKRVMMDEYSIDMNEHRATNIVNSNIEKMDLILCATSRHKKDVLRIYPKLEGKVFTMKEYVGYNREYHDKIDIKDPWGYDIETYRACVAEIDECLEMLLEKINNNKNNF